MTYPGDSSLADDIKARILATFDQALDLTDKGSRKEALLGCDFVLRLDPLFEPARVLHRRLSGEGAIRTDDLRGSVDGNADAVLELDTLESAAGDLEVTESLEPPPAEPRIEAEDGELMTTFARERVERPDPPLELVTPQLETPRYGTPRYGDAGFHGDPDDEESEPLGAAPQLDDESRRRITELLEEGQAAYDTGEYQSAIDAWSRVFLIDIDHAEANRRIEQARRMSAEVERQIEEVFHEAMLHLDSSDLPAARGALHRVLELQPGHLAAQEYLDRIDSGDVTPLETEPDEHPSHPASFALAEPFEEDDSADDLFATPDVAPDTAELRVPAETVVARKRPRRTFMMVSSLVLLLVALGGWVLVDRWDSLFPNSESAQLDDAPKRIDPIARARKLHEQGKTAIAIAQLRRLPPGDPHYSEAQALVAQWETAETVDEAAGPDPEELEQHQELTTRARAAHAQGEFLLASTLLERAAAIAPLDPETEAMRASSQAALEPLKEQIRVFRSGDWEYALPTLWRMRESDARNADINRLIIDSYYNLGVRDLQRGRADAAMKKFEEALGLRPDDPTLLRLRAFAAAYASRDEDLLYRIFVKYLPYR